MHELNSCSGSCVSRKAVETSASRLLAREWSEREERRRRLRAGLALAAREAASQCRQRATFNRAVETLGLLGWLDDPVFLGPVPKRGELCRRLFERSSEMRTVFR